jgi:hypothetical protein
MAKHIAQHNILRYYMEVHMKKMTKHVVAFLLVVCLTFGMCSNGLAVLADSFPNASKTFHYVSLGASQTNGYGLQG